MIEPGDLAVRADESAIVVAERLDVTLAQGALIARVVTTRAKLGIVAGGLVQVCARTFVIRPVLFDARTKSRVERADQAEVPRRDEVPVLAFLREILTTSTTAAYVVVPVPGSSQIAKCQLDNVYVKLRGPGVLPWLWPS